MPNLEKYRACKRAWVIAHKDDPIFKEKRRNYNRKWRETHSEQHRESTRKSMQKWRESNPERYNEVQRKMYHKNPSPFIVRAMVARMIKIADIRKTCRSYKYIGCTPDFLRGWLQAQFRDGMTWENYGKVWVVDHIKPLIAFELKDRPDRIFGASHYTNLQPLLFEENLRKGFKIA